MTKKNYKDNDNDKDNSSDFWKLFRFSEKFQIFGKFLDFQKILEKKLYEIDCNLIKDKLTEQIYISIVAFFDGTHQLVLHRNAECKSSAHVIAWFKKDPSAGFYDKPDVNEATLDKK